MILTTRRLAAAILFIGLFAMAARVAVDSDIFWHLRAGAWIVEHRQPLLVDVFSHTVTGQSWQYPAWLSEALLFGLYGLAGYAALTIFTAFSVTVAFAFVYATCEGGVYLKAWVIILAAAASSVFWSARPQIISFALSAATLYILDRFRQHNVNRLWLLPILMAVWSNTHPGFAVGFILIGLTLIGETVKAIVSAEGLAWRRVGWLVSISLACVLALLVSPYGLSQLAFPFKTVTSGLLQNYIQEWQSPNFHIKEAQIFIWLLIVTLAAVGFSRRSLDFTDLLLLSATLYLALIASRNIALFALVAAPVIAKHTQTILNTLAEKSDRFKALLTSSFPTTRRSIYLNWLILALVGLAALLKLSLPLDPVLNDQIVTSTLPVNAAKFILRTRPIGLLYNPYNWGGYLAWALYPDYLIYVDGRTDLYGDEFFSEYLRLAGGDPQWEQILAERDIRLLLLETASPLAQLARSDPDWQIRYTDPLASVFVKNNP